MGRRTAKKTDFATALADDIRSCLRLIEERKAEAEEDIEVLEERERYDMTRKDIQGRITSLQAQLEEQKQLLHELEQEWQDFRRGRVAQPRPVHQVKRRAQDLEAAPTVVLSAPRKVYTKKMVPHLKPAPPLNLEDDCLFQLTIFLFSAVFHLEINKTSCKIRATTHALRLTP